MLCAGNGFWITIQYPIGGDFGRAKNDMCVELTGKKIDKGQWYDFFEFKGINNDGKPITAYARRESFNPQPL